jgi:hypothetical protein
MDCPTIPQSLTLRFLRLIFRPAHMSAPSDRLVLSIFFEGLWNLRDNVRSLVEQKTHVECAMTSADGVLCRARKWLPIIAHIEELGIVETNNRCACEGCM